LYPDVNKDGVGKDMRLLNILALYDMCTILKLVYRWYE